MKKGKNKLNKKGNSKIAKVLRQKRDPRIEETYEEEIQFMCPKRGLVKQKVKIKKYKTLTQYTPVNTVLSSDTLSMVEQKDDGLSMFGAEDVDLEKEEK